MEIPDASKYPIGPSNLEVTDEEFEILNSEPDWYWNKLKALAEKHSIDISHPENLRDLPIMLPKEEVIPVIAELFTREGYNEERANILATEHIQRLKKPLQDMVKAVKNISTEETFDQKLRKSLDQTE